jgi:hypothetical protein
MSLGDDFALVVQALALDPSQRTEEFCRVREEFNAVLVCTSLRDDEATARVNLVPPDSCCRWQLAQVAEAQPWTCPDDSATHRHVVFEAVAR